MQGNCKPFNDTKDFDANNVRCLLAFMYSKNRGYEDPERGSLPTEIESLNKTTFHCREEKDSENS